VAAARAALPTLPPERSSSILFASDQTFVASIRSPLVVLVLVRVQVLVLPDVAAEALDWIDVAVADVALVLMGVAVSLVLRHVPARLTAAAFALAPAVVLALMGVDVDGVLAAAVALAPMGAAAVVLRLRHGPARVTAADVALDLMDVAVLEQVVDHDK